MTIWMDLTNSLTINKGNVVGIVRVELMFAKYLYEIDHSVKFFILNKYGFCEVKSCKLKWLFESQNMNGDYIKFQKRKNVWYRKIFGKIVNFFMKKIFIIKRHLRNKHISKKDFIIYPYKDNDTIYSCGWLGTKKEEFFLKIKDQLSNIRLVYTIYDLVLVMDNLRCFYTPADLTFSDYIDWIANVCDVIIYGGKTTQMDAENYFSKNGLNIPEHYWIRFGCDILDKNLQEKNNENKIKVLEKLCVKKPYILAVGSFDFKKNYDVLYRAYCWLRRHNEKNIPQLVIVGRTFVNNCLSELIQSIFNNPLIQNDIKIINNCNDDELDILYQNCKFTCLPSFYEGWSLTLPESLNYGKFCLASNVPPLMEIGEDIIDYADPYDPVEWAKKIKFYYTNSRALKQRENLIKEKWHNITWKESTQELYKYLLLSDISEVSGKKSVLYYDIGLIWYPFLTGIPKTQLLLARYLYKYNKNIKYFWISNGEYCEIPHRCLTGLLSREPLDTSILKDKEKLRSYHIVKQRKLPFRKNDIVFSAGFDYDVKSFNILLKMHKNIGFKYCNVIYDLTPIVVCHTHPEERTKIFLDYLNRMYNLCDYICYGGKTAQIDGEEYQHNNNLPLNRSFVLKFGSDIVKKKKHMDTEIKTVMEKYGIIGDFIMSVGTIEARKNQRILYDAYLIMTNNIKKNEKLPQIVICGHFGWKTEMFQRLISTDERIYGKVILITPTDDELDILYQNCKFTCLPSFYEGWSLTLPESLNYGKFCLASNVPPLMEIGEDIIDYADPYDPVEWAKKIKFYYTNSRALKQRENLIKEKWHNITWDDCAKNLNKILQTFMDK